MASAASFTCPCAAAPIPGVIGTAAYSAPELLNPESPDAAHAQRQPTIEGEERILKADVRLFVLV
jgi:hypothetical protein